MRNSRECPVLPAYADLLSEIDRWFSRAIVAHEAKVQCRRGCDQCCRGLFDITPLDAAWLAEGVRHAPETVRVRLAASARESLRELACLEPRWTAPYRIGEIGTERFDALCDALPSLPCPALAPDGACLVYEHRPLVCRAHGVPMFDPRENFHVGGACDLNDVSRESAETDPVLQFDHGTFEERELALLATAAGGDAARDPEAHGTVIAAAILRALAHDFGPGR